MFSRAPGSQPGKDSVDIFEMRGLVAGARRSGFESVDHHLQLSARSLGDFLQARDHGVATTAHAATGIGPRRKRVARPAGHQPFDQRAHAGLVHLGNRDGALGSGQRSGWGWRGSTGSRGRCCPAGTGSAHSRASATIAWRYACACDCRIGWPRPPGQDIRP